MTRRMCVMMLFVGLPGAAAALAQSTIDPDFRFAWAENAGWTNWQHDTPNPGDGVLVYADFLEGVIWGENVAWVNVGNGSGPYLNTTGLNFGVNLDPATGFLSGMAWGENTGWINFEGGALASPPNPARIEGNRLRGYVWGENVGWINLDDATHFIALSPPCEPCDTNCDGSVNGMDITNFVAALTGTPSSCSPCNSDTNADGSVNGFDIVGFVACLTAP